MVACWSRIARRHRRGSPASQRRRARRQARQASRFTCAMKGYGEMTRSSGGTVSSPAKPCHTVRTQSSASSSLIWRMAMSSVVRRPSSVSSPNPRVHEHLDAIPACAERSDSNSSARGHSSTRVRGRGPRRTPHPRELGLGDRTMQPQPDGPVVGVAASRVDRTPARDWLPRRRQLRVHPHHAAV